MIAIVITEDQHLQQTLSELLRTLGYIGVFTTDSVDEADYFFNKEQKKIKLILFENAPELGMDVPLARLIIQKPNLDLTTLIHISNRERIPVAMTQEQDQLSRIDYDLAKPFGIRQLKAAIQLAKRRRARLRNKIVILGNQHENDAVEAMYTTDVHWKKIFIAKNFEDFKKQIEQLQFRVGGIAIEPEFNSPEIISYLDHFKKSSIGSSTPLMILGKNAEQIHPFRDYGDLYFDPEETSWSEILETTSNRVIYHGEILDALQEAKRLIRSKKINKAKKAIEAVLALDPFRWELLEMAGRIHDILGNKSKAIEYYQLSLLHNPCNPSIYIYLTKMLKDTARKEMLELGQDYCPYHPQVKSLEP